MKYRIAMWAAAGFLVRSAWAIYFLVASKDYPIEPIASILVRLTCPVAIVGSHYPLSLYSALVANVATYARSRCGDPASAIKPLKLIQDARYISPD